MRILHVIHSVDPRSGGPSHALRAIVQGQVSAGHEVALLTTVIQATEPWQPREIYRQMIHAELPLRGCEVHLVEAWGRRKPWATYAYSPAGRRWLRQRLADPLRSPEVVHIHGVFSHITSLAAAESRRQDIPYIVRPAGILDAPCLRLGRAWLKRLFLHCTLGHDLQMAAGIQATSGLEAEEIARWAPATKVYTVPLGVDVGHGPSNNAAAEPFLARCPKLRGKRIILYLGRIAAKKRPELLVDAVSVLRKEISDLALVFAGSDDGAMATVRAAVERHGLDDIVVHAGFLQGVEKEAAFAVARLFALPSLDENFGVAVVEAMAHGLPVLVTPGVAAREYVEASGGGLVVQGTPEALAAGIRRILGGKPQEIGLRGRAFVESHLSWPVAIARLDDLYRCVAPVGYHDCAPQPSDHLIDSDSRNGAPPNS